MRKKISEMTAADKAEFLEQAKRAMVKEQGVPWELIEPRIIEEIENTFDDEKFIKMDPDFFSCLRCVSGIICAFYEFLDGFRTSQATGKLRKLCGVTAFLHIGDDLQSQCDKEGYYLMAELNFIGSILLGAYEKSADCRRNFTNKTCYGHALYAIMSS